MPFVTILKGPTAGTRVDLADVTSVEIGRKPNEAQEEGHRALALDDPRASRAHCRIDKTPEGWVLRDLGSSNGTVVGGRRVTTTFLAPGDRIRVGATLLRWDDALVVEELRTSEESEEEVEGQLDGLPVSPRRRWALAAALGAVAAVAALAYVLLSGDGGAPGAQVDDRAREAPSVDSSKAPVVASASDKTVEVERLPPDPEEVNSVTGTAVVPAPPDPTPEVESFLRSRDYRRALGYLDGLVEEYRLLDVSGLRERIHREARAELDLARNRVESHVGAGKLEDARSVLIDLVPRVPLDLSNEMAGLFEIVEVADAQRVVGERVADSEPRERFRDALNALLNESRRLGEKPSVTPGEWTALRDAVAKLVREEIDNVLYPRHRETIEDVFLRAETSLRESDRRSLAFHATKITWQPGEDGDGPGDELVTLVYEFAGASELEDFRLLSGERATLDIDRGALRLRGECRLLSGYPFRDRLEVRGEVVPGGFDPNAPNMNVALFTSERDRLSSPTGQVRSLLRPAVAGPGGPPEDFVLFGIGYRTAVAEYAGRFVEELRVEGQDAPVPFPAYVLLAGRRGAELHSDPREPLWAAALRGTLPRGPRFEVGLDGNRVTWTLQGREVLPSERSSLARLDTERERVGSVTWVTYQSEVRLQRLEVQGILRRSWLYEGIQVDARAAFEAVEAAARTESPARE